MLTYIDSHAHYDDEAFDGDRDALLNQIHSGGVAKIINIGCSLQRSEYSVRLAEKFSFIYAAVGVHPDDSLHTPDGYLSELERLAAHKKVVAIGEIGLDYHSEGFNRERQIRFFREQLDLAERLNLPVVIHSRDATEDTLDILRQRKKTDGVMHCFSGSAETAKEVLALGLYIGFTGVITFKNARKAVAALRAIPLDRLLVETDCPYMAPEPFRGKRCDSSMIVSDLTKIAEEKGISPELAAEHTMNNALRLFSRMA